MKPSSKAKYSLSVVTTVFRSERFIRKFNNDLVETLGKITVTDYEIIYVIDGSPDNSLNILLDLKQDNSKIRVIELSRNFGQHAAILAGLGIARNNLVFLIDCDLEVPPSVLQNFFAKFYETGADVIFGYQQHRKGSFTKKTLGGLFWKVFNTLSSTAVPESILNERLMTRKYVDHLLECGDKNVFLGGLYFWVGFKQIGIPIEKNSRSDSSYSLSRRIRLLVDAITSFSGIPLRIFFVAGTLVSLGSFLYGVFLIGRKLVYPDVILTGYTSLAVLITFSFGIILSALGLIGIYISKIFTQVQNRPLYIIRNDY